MVNAPTIEQMDLTLFEYCKSKDDCKKKCVLYDEETRCLRRPDRIEQNYWKLCALGELKRMEIKKKMSSGSNDFTLCWKCARAYGGCNWSDGWKPVDGWVAEPTTVKLGTRSVKSYFVKNCPEFEHEKAMRPSDMTDDGVANLCGSIVKLAAWDYKNLLDREAAFTPDTPQAERENVAFDKYNCERVLPDEIIANIKNGIPIKTRIYFISRKRGKKKK